jgi:hypothetical protein
MIADVMSLPIGIVMVRAGGFLPGYLIKRKTYVMIRMSTKGMAGKSASIVKSFQR